MRLEAIEGVTGSVEGNVPVQAEGEVDGLPFYFRARNDSYSLTIVRPGVDPVEASLPWRSVEGIVHYVEGFWFNAGWMDEKDAARLIKAHIRAFRLAGETANRDGSRSIPAPFAQNRA